MEELQLWYSYTNGRTAQFHLQSCEGRRVTTAHWLSLRATCKRANGDDEGHEEAAPLR